jgi:SNF2 family DNA or RNA helicase
MIILDIHHLLVHFQLGSYICFVLYLQGLGKTYQTLAYVGGLMRTKTIRNALVVAPVSVMRTWQKEAEVVIKKECVKCMSISIISSDVPKEKRVRLLRQALRW